MDTRTVLIPACVQHEGIYSILVKVQWVCPVCGGPRGEPFNILSYDGSLRMQVQGWTNPCGHVDKYGDVRREALSLISDELKSNGIDQPEPDIDTHIQSQG